MRISDWSSDVCSSDLENFFRIHNCFRDNCDAIDSILNQIDDRFFLAVTNHPLNELYVDNSALDQFIEDRQDRVAIVSHAHDTDSATRLAASTSHRFIFANTKSLAAAALLVTPILRIPPL